MLRAMQQTLLDDALDVVPAAPRPDHLGTVRTITYQDANQILAPASGFISAYKFTLNPYSGCGFACDYCYARFFSPSFEQQQTWGEWVRVKENALALIARATRSRSEKLALHPGDSIYMSSVTDPYQPIEAKLELSRAILRALIPFQPRLTVQTRSPIVARDIDLLQQLKHVRVSMSVPTDSEEVRLRYEPHAPAIGVRLETLEKLRDAAVPVGVAISPMLPMKEPAAFGKRIAALDAAEYVAQWMHTGRSRFSAGTPMTTVDKFAEDGWTEPAYRDAFDAIAAELGPDRPLFEGAAGFQPPQ